MSLKSFFQAESVGIIGVSANHEKLGSIIFQNILDSGFLSSKTSLYGVNPKLSEQSVSESFPDYPKKESVFYANISDIKSPLDLVVIVIPSRFTMASINDCVKNKAKNIIIISAGFSEVGDSDLENQIKEKCEKNNINLLGPNCLGAIFPYSNLNASFSDGFPQKGNICFVSQSGAFCTAVLDWANEKKIGFSHFISLGNKAGISETQILEELADDDRVEIFAFYLESLENGKKFLNLIQKISQKKPIIILEPGKSEKAKIASSSHTGSLAPNFKILEKAYKNSGAIQVFSMREMFGILELLTFQKNKSFEKNLAILTNAGGVGVLSSDLSAENHLNLIDLCEETKKLLAENLPAEASFKNPVDIIGDAKADRYEKSLEILCNDENIDQILVLLTPQRTTEVLETAKIVAKYAKKSDKNIVASFVGGKKIAVGVEYLKQQKVPHFKFPTDATKILGILANREKQLSETIETIKTTRDSKIEKFIFEAKKKKLKSLPQIQVDKILEFYGFDFPASHNFDPMNELENAEKFAKNIFPQKVVLKISSPDFLHKTDLKGVFLNIDSVEKFMDAWENLKKSIEISGISNAQIQIQEQISEGLEIILGMKTDPNFGKILLFGQGGIFTEIFSDTTVSILPKNSKYFEKMILETRIGNILKGTRGKKFAVKKLIETMEKIQALVLDFPEITAIDGNPFLVNETRTVAVDFKILI